MANNLLRKGLSSLTLFESKKIQRNVKETWKKHKKRYEGGT